MKGDSMNNHSEKIRFFALGGQDEDGKNMMCLEIDDRIFVIEAGLKYPDQRESLGIEFIVQDFSYLVENKDRIEAIFITHGHDDVMGALPYLLESASANVYASPMVSKILHKQLRSMKITGSRIYTVKRHDTKKIGKHKVIFFPITHNFPSTYGLAIFTSYGYIVYSGEFIMDYDDLTDDYRGDIRTLTTLGMEGVFLLLQESKGAERSGHTSPNHRIAPAFSKVLERNENKRIFVSVYSQSVYRLQEILNTCMKYNRRMFIYNKDLQEMLEYLKAVGYEVPSKYIVTEKEFKNSMKDIVVIISSQGPVLFNMIHNIANNEDDLISMDDQDVICMASRVIAGTGKDFAAMENDIYKLNAELIVLGDQVINMHPSVEDLKMMLFILRPKYYIPVKGQYRQLYMNAELAMNMGYSPSNILILDNGQVAQFENGRLVSCRMEFDLKDVLVDGKKNWDMAGVVLKDRETLSTDGVIILAIGIDAKTKKIINGPDIQTRGLIYLKDAEYITKDVAKIMEETIENDVANKKYDNMETRQAIRDKVSRYLLRQTAKRPMILPVIMEINT